MGGSISTTFLVASTGPVAPTVAPSVSLGQSGDVIALAWNGIAGVSTYEVVQASASGQALNITTGGVNYAVAGAGVQELDAQGIVGQFVGSTQAAFQVPPGLTVRFMVRGVTGTGSSGLGGPYSSPVTASTPAGSPAFAVAGISGASVSNGRLYVAVALRNTGTAGGSMPGTIDSPTWSGVLVNSSGRVAALVTGQDNVYLNPGQQTSQTGSGDFALVPGAYTIFAAFGPGYYQQYNSTYDLGYGPTAPFRGEIAGTVGAQVSL